MEILSKDIEDIIIDYKYQLEHWEKMKKVFKNINNMNYHILKNNIFGCFDKFSSKKTIKKGLFYVNIKYVKVLPCKGSNFESYLGIFKSIKSPNKEKLIDSKNRFINYK